MTNLERIRQTPADKLAEYIDENCPDLMDYICIEHCGIGGECDNGENCKACVIDWLGKEAALCTL